MPECRRTGNAKRNGKYRFSSVIFSYTVVYFSSFLYGVCRIFFLLLLWWVFFSPVRNICCVRLFLMDVVFRLQRCDQDSYITDHSDTMHVHTYRVTCGCFKRVIYFLLCLRVGKRKKIVLFLVRWQAKSKQAAETHWQMTDENKKKTTKCLVTGANRVVLFYNWHVCVPFYSLHFVFAGG